MSTKEPDDGRPAGDAGESPVPDEIWEKFVQDPESEIRATAPKEPSARARMVTARLLEQDARAAAQQGRRKRRFRKTTARRSTACLWRRAVATGRREEQRTGSASARRPVPWNCRDGTRQR